MSANLIKASNFKCLHFLCFVCINGWARERELLQFSIVVSRPLIFNLTHTFSTVTAKTYLKHISVRFMLRTACWHAFSLLVEHTLVWSLALMLIEYGRQSHFLREVIIKWLVVHWSRLSLIWHPLSSSSRPMNASETLIFFRAFRLYWPSPNNVTGSIKRH